MATATNSPSPTMSPDTAPGPSPIAAGRTFIQSTSENFRKPFYDSSFTLTTTTQAINDVSVDPYDYARYVWIRVNTTAAGGGSGVTLAADGPFNALQNIKIETPGGGQPLFYMPDGHKIAMINKYGGISYYKDPRAYPTFAYSTGSGTAPTMEFMLKIPFEFLPRVGLGTLENKNAASPYKLSLSLNTLANVFGGSPTTPTIRVRMYLAAYDMPPESEGGVSNQQTPPVARTWSRWRMETIAYSSGGFTVQRPSVQDAYVRMYIPIVYRTSSTRQNGDADWPDPMQFLVDDTEKYEFATTDWQNYIYEHWGYGYAGSTVETRDGRDYGVYPYSYAHDLSGRVSGDDLAQLYTPTISSQKIQWYGSFGNAGTMYLLVNEILPTGDIWSAAL